MLAIVFACAVPAFAADKKKEEKTPVPDVTTSAIQWTEVVNGVPFDKAATAGKVIVIDEWGVNCGPCIALLPEMAKIAKSVESKGVVVVGMEKQNGTVDQIMPLLKKAQVKYPVMAGGDCGVPSTTIPHATVYGVDGKLVWAGNPSSEGDAFKKALREAMKAAPATAKTP